MSTRGCTSFISRLEGKERGLRGTRRKREGGGGGGPCLEKKGERYQVFPGKRREFG